MNIKSMLIWALRRGQTKSFIRRSADLTSRIDRFNAIWEDAYRNVPFYAEWKEKHDLPDVISDLSELNKWPVLEKRELINNADKLIRKNYTGKYHESVTGGATGEPLHFRTWGGESDIVSSSKWLGWAQYGIYPDSRCFLLWGHRHFYGQGLKSNIKFAIRRLKDWLVNNYRADATDLSRVALEKDVKAILKFKPDAIIAYSASLLALCKALPEYAERCKALKIKAVICTAGPLTRAERIFIGEYFGCEVGMEYGSMEGGVIAYMNPAVNGRYSIFQDTHILHVGKELETGNNSVLVTKLYSSYLPLIRYKIGDYIKNAEVDEHDSVCTFDEVYGRSGDEVDMGGGIRFHGQAFMVCAEGFDQIVAYQLRVNKSESRVIFVAQTFSSLSEEEKNEIKKRASHMSGLPISSIDVQVAVDLIKAPSGKIRLVIEE